MRTHLFEKEIRLFGIKRSGNNALIMYIGAHFDLWANLVLVTNSDFNFASRSGRKNPFAFANAVYVLEAKDPEKLKHLMVVTENYDLSIVKQRDGDRKYSFNKDRGWYANIHGFRHFSREIMSVLILRSPHNNLASIMEKGKHMAWFVPDFARLWVMYAREIVGETKYLRNMVPCLFDEWFSSLEYRKSLCDELGIDHTDDGLNRIRNKRRSSFEVVDEAQDLKVLDRWKYYKDDKEYLNILRNDELIDLTQRIFGYDIRDILDL